MRLASVEQQVADLNVRTSSRELELGEGKEKIAELSAQLLLLGNPDRLAQRLNNQVDLRILGKPKEFNGTQEQWSTWSFQLESFCGACDQELADMMLKATQREEPIPMVATTRRSSCVISFLSRVGDSKSFMHEFASNSQCAVDAKSNMDVFRWPSNSCTSAAVPIKTR